MRLRRGDSGFTLIELLVAMTIAGIIAAGIGAAVSSGLFNTHTTETRLAESHDAEIAARYFSGDAASTDPAQFNPSTTSCDDGTPSTTVVTFQWTEQQSVPPSVLPTSVPHVVKWTVQGIPAQLVREECVNGASAGDLIMARNLNGSPLAPSCTNEAGATATCNASSDVKTVALSVTTPSAYTYSLNGTLRITGTAAGNPPAPPAIAPLILLGGSGTNLTVSGTPALNVYGNVVITSTSNNPIKESGNSTFKYSQIEVGPGGTCTLPNCSVVSPLPTDPFAGVPQPTTTGLVDRGTSSSDVGCGVYHATLKITSNDQLNPTGAPGCIYYLMGGMSISANVQLTTNPAGALIYLSGESSSGTMFSSAGSATCDFIPIQDDASPYYGMVIFATRTPPKPPSQETINVQGSNGTAYHGSIYAPSETVSLSGTAGNNLDIGGIVAYAVTTTGTNTASIGTPPGP